MCYPDSESLSRSLHEKVKEWEIENYPFGSFTSTNTPFNSLAVPDNARCLMQATKKM
jgi:hypothetical protein